MDPIGYKYLTHLIDDKCIENYCASFLGTRHKRWKQDGILQIAYPKSYKLKNMDDPLDHLEFAFKHEGYHQPLLEMLFQYLESKAILARIKAKPTGVFERRLWYVYESLTGKRLDLPDLKKGNYVDLINPKIYYTSPGMLQKRQRIRHNLLGPFAYCPMVRKTPSLASWEEQKLNEQMIKLIKSIDPRVITRATHYLYNKETLSSWEIERERPSQHKVNRYVDQLKACTDAKIPTKKDLIAWQNLIIEDRFQEPDYRKIQNYIGYTMRDFSTHVEYIPPPPKDVPELMEGLLAILESDHQIPVVLAAIVSFGFVFIHPFRDGNGRLHRLLLHTVLAQKGYTPKGLIFPLSAVMLKHIQEYEELLQSYSGPLMQQISYQFVGNKLETLGDTTYLYRSWDMTRVVEYTYACIEKTIDEEFQDEIDYLIGYDKAYVDIQKNTKLTDREIDLLIRCIVQNHGTLGKEKRHKFFTVLSDKEVQRCEKSVNKYLQKFSK